MGWHRTTRCSLGSAYYPIACTGARREVRAWCCPASACALSLSSHPAHLGPHVLVGSWSLCVERLSVIGCGCVSSRSTSTSVFTPSPRSWLGLGLGLGCFSCWGQGNTRRGSSQRNMQELARLLDRGCLSRPRRHPRRPSVGMTVCICTQPRIACFLCPSRPSA